jgi:hypothetical protein
MNHAPQPPHKRLVAILTTMLIIALLAMSLTNTLHHPEYTLHQVPMFNQI